MCHPIPFDSVALLALVASVGPFLLHFVCAERLYLPGADVANLAVVVVIPAASGNRVGDGFAELVRAGGSERVERAERAEAAIAVRVGHGGVEDLAVDVVVVSAERLA